MKTTDVIANDAFATAKRVADYYLKTFGRDGWDNKGSAVRVKVHAPDLDGTVPMNNARWYLDEGRIWVGDGDGVEFAPLGKADDVMAHEYGHGVIDSEVVFGQELQEGAIHESWSDVFASGIDGNWLIGERVYTPRIPGDALRDMSSPRYSDMGSLPPVLDPMNDVHDVSGVATLAAVRAADSIGAGEMRQVWYKALTDHMQDHSGYAGARDATLAAATKMYGKDSSQVSAIRDAWDGVGITSATPKQLFGFEHQSAIAAVKGESVGRTALWANGQPPKGASGTHFGYRGSQLLAGRS
jgi:aureolysin